MTGAEPMRQCLVLTLLVCMLVATSVVGAGPGLTSFNDPRTCKGYESQFKDCESLPVCYECEPVDCSFSDWGEWFEAGGCTGVCFRHRSIVVSNNECGKPCAGVKQESKECLKEECTRIPVDCQFSDWGEWSVCGNDYTAQKARLRHIAVHPKDGGSECEGPMNETLPCGKTPAIDCELSEWGTWTECSASCGGGWRSQMRRVLTPASLGGQPCEGTIRRTETCNTLKCGKQKPCVLGAWSDWSGCGLVGGIQKYRSREVERPAEYGGEPCAEAVKETLGCPQKVKDQEPCRLSAWTEWAACGRTCDGGQTYRKRHIEEGPQNGGACPSESLHETKACGAEPCTPPGINDCGLSDWGEWSECSAKCGVGVVQRERTIVAKAKLGGKGCTAALKETEACRASKEMCGATDCVWADWEQWSACTCTCGGGTMRRERMIKVAPTNGGKLCEPEDKSEVAPCAIQSCGACVDGAWGDWEDWSVCSVSCGDGFRSRHRDVAQHPNECGKPAVGLEEEFESCAAASPCVPDADCLLSDWSSWSACSSKCFGVAERQRHIVQYAIGRGKACHMESAKEVVQCNPGMGEDAPTDCGKPDPEACMLGEWSSWGKCSASCGGGQHIRVRHLLSPARNDGEPCTGELSMTAPCATQACPDTCQDCEWAEWSDWGVCSKCGDQRYRHRSIAVMSNHCGKPCDAAAAKEASSCNSTCGSTRFCAWTEWSSYSACSAQCGPATRLRQRAMAIFQEQPDSYLFAGPASTWCSGAQMEIGACEHKTCGGDKAAVDCVFGAWSEWSAPACSQLCERSRVIDRTGENGGELCKGQLVETKRCQRDCTHAEDCLLSDWGEWGHCEKRESQRYRSRSVLRYASNGGSECHGNLEETASCSGPPADVVACAFGQWSEWGQCSQSCGGGLRTRGRQIEGPAEHGGEMCEGRLEELTTCSNQTCEGAPVPCVMGDWGQWSDCSQGASGFSRSRGREVLRVPKSGGAACSATLKEVAPCSKAVDCKLSEWTTWDECDKSCGGGQRARHRQVVQNPEAGGAPCSPSLMEIQGCSLAPCNRRDCAVSDWGEWSVCTASCGSGQQVRSRHVAQMAMDGGDGCHVRLNETRDCRDGSGRTLPVCPTVDCVWGLWSDWSSCSSPCDGGMRTRDRHIIQAPQRAGKPCKAWNKEETEPCGTQKCDNRMCSDGQWDDWEDWEPCSSSCEGGITWRTRKVLAEANECGKPAVGPSRLYASCNLGIPCEPDVDCVLSDWGMWSDCSKTCDGLMRRSRHIAVTGRGTGTACSGDLKQTAPCNPAVSEAVPAACAAELPKDCVLSDWQAWGTCSVSCGGGQQTRSREVLKEAMDGGKCPHAALAETQACSNQACPDECAPTACEWGAWSSWSACDKCGGEQRRFRHVRSVARCGGEPCSAGLSEEVASCTRKCHEPSYCDFGEWTAWSVCSASCGSGVHKRTRQLQIMASPEPRFLEDSTSLQEKFQLLRAETRQLERQRVQVMAVSFAAGLLTLVVGLAAFRAYSRRQHPGLLSPGQQREVLFDQPEE